MINTYTNAEKKLYIIGVVGQAMIYEVITTGLSYYLQSVIFIPAMVISIIFTISRIWDAIKNPIMGSIVDRTKTRWGKCRPYLLFAPPIVCFLTILCFANEIYRDDNSIFVNTCIVLWATISYILWGLFFTLTDVPLWGIISLMTNDDKDRSRVLISARNAANIGCGIVSFAIVYISQIVGEIVAQKIDNKVYGLKYGVFIVAVIITIFASIMFQMAGFFTKERICSYNMESKSIKQNFLIMWNCLPFRQLLLSGILRSPTSLMRKIQITLLSYYYGDNGQTAYLHYFLLLGGGYMVGQFVFIALTPKFISKVTKEKAFFYSNLFSIVPYLLLFIVYCMFPCELHKFPWLIIVFISFFSIGASSGVISVLQSLMIADTVDYEEYHTGYRPDAVFYSLQSFLSNFSGGVASIIVGITFSLVGFSGEGVKKVNDLLYKGESFKSNVIFKPYRVTMFSLCTIGPVIGLLLSLIPLRKYSLLDSEYKLISERLKVMREEKNNI